MKCGSLLLSSVAWCLLSLAPAWGISQEGPPPATPAEIFALQKKIALNLIELSEELSKELRTTRNSLLTAKTNNEKLQQSLMRQLRRLEAAKASLKRSIEVSGALSESLETAQTQLRESRKASDELRNSLTRAQGSIAAEQRAKLGTGLVSGLAGVGVGWAVSLLTCRQ